MITPTNISKSTITPTGASKTGTSYWGDPVATWGDAIVTWGYNYVVSNINKATISPTGVTKSSQGGSSTVVGSPIGLLLSLTYATATSSGSGYTNISKNPTTFTNISKS